MNHDGISFNGKVMMIEMTFRILVLFVSLPSLSPWDTERCEKQVAQHFLYFGLEWISDRDRPGLVDEGGEGRGDVALEPHFRSVEHFVDDDVEGEELQPLRGARLDRHGLGVGGEQPEFGGASFHFCT